MTPRFAPNRATMLTASVVTAAVLSLAPTTGALAADTAQAPVSAVAVSTVTGPDVLSSTPWETTGAVDQDGTEVALTDEAVVNFVGWAYYSTDGTFTMYNLDDTPKMQGDWSVTPDGSERTLVAKDDAGQVMFERVVPITELTEEVFTYRVIPDEATPEVYYDIIHTATDHLEPGAATSAEAEAASDAAGTTADAETPADADDAAAVEASNPVAIVAIVAGVIAVLGGAALYITRVVRRKSTD